MDRFVGDGYSVAIVGSTGVVGREMLSVLGESSLPVRKLRLAASDRSVGATQEFAGRQIEVEALRRGFFTGLDFAFFSAGAAVSREFCPEAAAAGAVVVDNSSAFRMENDVPLVIPEVNPQDLKGIAARGIVAVPNCAAIQLLVALAPLHRQGRIRRIVVSTYQSTSGAGRRAMEELSRQVADLYNCRETVFESFPRRIAFDLIPQIGDFAPDGSTGEESKIEMETRKILADPSIGVSATAVRVPTFNGHAESVNVETERSITPENAREILCGAPGVRVVDSPLEAAERRYPVLADATGRNEVLVGRIRRDGSRENCLNLWVVGDNLRKGAAYNGLQIIEALAADYRPFGGGTGPQRC